MTVLTDLGHGLNSRRGSPPVLGHTHLMTGWPIKHAISDIFMYQKQEQLGSNDLEPLYVLKLPILIVQRLAFLY